MDDDGSPQRNFKLKVLFVAVAALAVVIGLALPGPHKSRAEPRSQFTTIEVGRG